jgi:hypothetical protein
VVLQAVHPELVLVGFQAPERLAVPAREASAHLELELVGWQAAAVG